ncbi:hypothetical protein PV08_05796 [Exophiala spinifera]|uniref:Thioesterase domain-containing protein n=1 Tax=Exophiala spinifera TaxID=91928 RepID=A0A0D1YL23_9EURO|nr:uncharacterized protein PV08_05796 [Exophiala spinifera]KIW15746.1 hypothetical protein PV08_05796 [Exophiala spinifera]
MSSSRPPPPPPPPPLLPLRSLNIHPDFSSREWCTRLLSDPGIANVVVPTDSAARAARLAGVSNSMFTETLNTPRTVRAQVSFNRPTHESDALASTGPGDGSGDGEANTSPSTSTADEYRRHTPREYCSLFSLGPGLDGKTGRAHGGFNALLLDQLTGHVGVVFGGSSAPATATMTVDYRAPISTPGVVLGRAWAVERSGRKTWVKGVIEDGEGKALAAAKALFVDPKPVTPEGSCVGDDAKAKSKL